jgi:hypothetical protein
MANPQQEEEVTDADFAAAQEAPEEEVTDSDFGAAASAQPSPPPVTPQRVNAPPKPQRNILQRMLTSPEYSEHRDMMAIAANPMLAPSILYGGKVEEGARGVLDALTAGFGDEATGALVSRFPSLNRSIGDVINGTPAPPAMSYEQARDQERAIMRDAADNSPATYYGAGLAANLTTPSLIPGLKFNMAPKMGGLITEKTANAAANAALSGGINALGTSEAELTGDDKEIGQTAFNVGRGALGAGLFAGGMSRAGEFAADNNLVPRFAEWLQEKLRTAAERRAVKAATGQNQAFWKAEENKDKIQDIGRTLLDRNIVTAGKSQREIRDGIESLKNQAGDDIGKKLERMDEIAGLNQKISVPEDVLPLTHDLMLDLKDGPVAQRAAASRVADELKNLLSNVEKEVPNRPARGRSVLPSWRPRTRMDYSTPMDLQDLNRFKSQLDDSINWDSQEPKPIQNALRRLRGILNEAVETKAEDIATTAQGRYMLSGQMDAQSAADARLFDEFMKAKKTYGEMEPLMAPALVESIRQDSNRWLSPSDYIALSSGGLLGSLSSGGSHMTSAMAGGALASLNKLARARGPQVAAAGMDALADSKAMSGLLNGSPDDVYKVATAPDQAATYAIGRAAGDSLTPDDSNSPRARANTPEGQRFYQQVLSSPALFGNYASRLQQAAQYGPESLAMQDHLLSADPNYMRMRKAAANGGRGE